MTFDARAVDPMPGDVNCGTSMTDHRPIPPAERPKAEPEIIPPGPGGPQTWIWRSAGDRRARFVYIETRGLFVIVLALLLLLCVVSVALLAILLGVVLLWIPLALGFALALILSRVFGRRGR
jgi:hypothetical protein